MSIGCLWAGLALGRAADSHYGFLFDEHRLTLGSGVRQEALGPLFYSQKQEATEQWAVPPLFSWARNHDPDLDTVEWDFLYPLMTFDRFGTESRVQFFQLLSLAGGQTMDDQNKKRFTIFPIYFQQRSTEPTNNYTALFPIYGTLRNRLFRDEVKFAAFPLYLQTRRRGVTTDNYLYPFFHLRRGEQLSGWQFWPIAGRERREPRTIINSFGDPEVVPGYRKNFFLWPFFLDQVTGLGTDNPNRQQALLPFYRFERSPLRDSTSYLWPLGLTITDDREKKYHEVGAPWPFIVFARGEGKTASRVWPFYSHAANASLQSDFVLWPIYKYNRAHTEQLDRDRVRILFYLYSDIRERRLETGESRRRTDLWPLFVHRRDIDGSQRLQLLAPLETFLPENKAIERNWSPLWALWRSEKNPGAQSASQSLLWNLYRHETAPGREMASFLFGMFQYRSALDERPWRVFWIPLGKSKTNPAQTSLE